MESSNFEAALYLFLIFLSFSISVGGMIFTYYRRGVMGAKSFAAILACEAAWAFGFFFETINPTLQGKMFWDHVEWLPILVMPLTIAAFASEYSGKKFNHRWPRIFALTLIPLVALTLVYTNSLWSLAFIAPHLEQAVPFPQYTYDLTPQLWFSLYYAYGLTIYSVISLVSLAFRQKGVFSRQTWIIAIGFLIPLFSTVLTVLGINLGPHRDSSPFAFILSNLVVAFGLFRYRIFDLVPFARELVMDRMEDGIIILDASGRVVDTNPVALAMLGKSGQKYFGLPAKAFFPEWLLPIDVSGQIQSAQREIWPEPGVHPVTYDLRITRLVDQAGGFSGQLLILRDISDRKLAEDVLQTAFAGMQQQVAEKTEVLRASEERFRSIVQNSYDLITILDQENRIRFVSPAISQILGYSSEELLGRSPFEIIHPDDIRITQDELSHVFRGEFAHTLFEFRARHVNGSWVYLESNSQNLMGNPAVEGVLIMSRDVSARRRAEEEARRVRADLDTAYEATLEGWSRALELRERETAGHSQRVVQYTLALARNMGFDEEACVHIRRGALLHDIGKIGIPDSILLKNDQLTPEEWEIIRQHPVYARNLLEEIPYLKPALVIPYLHHERWNGSGYPLHLQGQNIPFEARIFAVVDAWDALMWDRPYRKGWPETEVNQYLISQAGILFDPDVVNAFISMRPETESAQAAS